MCQLTYVRHGPAFPCAELNANVTADYADFSTDLKMNREANIDLGSLANVGELLDANCSSGWSGLAPICVTFSPNWKNLELFKIIKK